MSQGGSTLLASTLLFFAEACSDGDGEIWLGRPLSGLLVERLPCTRTEPIYAVAHLRGEPGSRLRFHVALGHAEGDVVASEAQETVEFDRDGSVVLRIPLHGLRVERPGPHLVALRASTGQIVAFGSLDVCVASGSAD